MPSDPFLDATPEQRIDRQMRAAWATSRPTSSTSSSPISTSTTSGAWPLFPDATFVVRRQELRAAWWPDAYERGYDFDRLLQTRDLKYLQPADGETFDVFEDGSLVCIDTKGHTEGHQSLVVTCPSPGRIVLVGDAAQVAENLDGQGAPRPVLEQPLPCRPSRGCSTCRRRGRSSSWVTSFPRWTA